MSRSCWPAASKTSKRRDCARGRGLVHRAQGQRAQVDGLARLVDRLVAAEQQTVGALQQHGRHHLVLAQVAGGGHDQLGVALPVRRHVELHRGRAGGVGDAVEDGAGQAGLAHLHIHVGAGDGLVVLGVVDHDAQRGLAAGGQRVLAQHQGLLRAVLHGQLGRAEHHAEEEHGHQGDGRLAQGAQPCQQRRPQAGQAGALLAGALEPPKRCGCALRRGQTGGQSW